MLIRRMTASFGKLQGQSLELKDGLNILQAPNETGKSTWCAFLLSMLYGVNSRERERSGFIPDKIRYAPWHGSSMRGRLDCLADGTEITLTRSTRRQNAPMGDFLATYTGTGDAVSSLTATNCGESLLGVSREVFERSAFIRQSGLAITQDAGLERRIAALITSGEEDTSYFEAVNALKKQLNRRRHNKTGQLPLLETQLQETQRQLADSAQLAQQLAESNHEVELLTQQESVLRDEITQHEQWETTQQRKTLLDAETSAQRAEAAAALLKQQLITEQVPENETIARLRGAIVNLETTRKAVEKARAERDTAAKALLKVEAAVNDGPFAGQTAEQARATAITVPKVAPSKIPSIVSFLAGLALATGSLVWIFFHAAQLPPWGTSLGWGLFTIITLLSALISYRIRIHFIQVARSAALIKQFGTDAPDEIMKLANAHIALLKDRDAARAETDKYSAAADTIYNIFSSNEQALLLKVRQFAPFAFDVSTADKILRECAQQRKTLMAAEATAQKARLQYEMLSQQVPTTSDNAGEAVAPPTRDRDTVSAELAQIDARLSLARSASDKLDGQLRAMGDPAVLESTAKHLEQQIEELQEEYDAITIAMEALDTANIALQNRFSPALGKRTAEIFSELTEQRYSSVALDRSFHISTEPAGDTIHRDVETLSAGTADQLYLAARLAICNLVLPESHSVPLILDDALANFDDQRCAAALRWLKKEARTRQILLFTCHSREADFFAGDHEVSIQQLTNTV